MIFVRNARPTFMKIRNYNHFLMIESYLLILPAIIILILFFLYPAIYNVYLSAQKISLFQLAQGGAWVGFDNYVELLQDNDIALALQNTVIWLTLMTIVLRLALGLGIALLLNAKTLQRWRLSGIATTMALIPWVVPPVVGVGIWKLMVHPRYGVINQVLLETGLIGEGIPFLVNITTVWWVIVAIVVWRELPFVIISLLAGLKAIPDDLYEAARVDGASPAQSFRYITFPLLRPVMVIITLLMTIWTYNNFVYVWLATQGGPGNFTQVLATEMYTEAFTNFRLGYGATIGVVMSLIMVAFSLVYFLGVFRKSMADGS